jgi:PIN domain nuclease of toxin-antitoxin system
MLLDTCAVIWLIEDQLKTAAVEALAASYKGEQSLYISPITALELGRLFAQGRLRSWLSPTEYWKRVLAIPRVKLAPMPPELLFGSSFLPGPIHKDPADRIIAATAREYGFTVMTRDQALLDYGAQGYLSIIEC